MIEGLANLLKNDGQTGLAELRAKIQELLGGVSVKGRLIDEEKLNRSRVYRLSFEITGNIHSFVVKRFSLDRAYREQLVIRRWLPAVGLSQSGPPLLGVAAERSGECIWHVYEDLGDCSLNKLGLDTRHSGLPCDRNFQALLEDSSDYKRLKAVIDLIAQTHMRFIRSPLIAECRQHGTDLGIHFYNSSISDAIGALESLSPPDVKLSFKHRELRDRLLHRMKKLLDDKLKRTQMMKEFGGPDTFLHGDVDLNNIMVYPTELGPQVRLIDWEHVGVGPVSYDLSNLLVQFPSQDRQGILKLYQQAMEGYGQPWPSVSVWNHLFDTAECARLANSVIWPAIAAKEGHTEWAFDELSEIDGWFEKMQSVLPLNEGRENA
jgi:thiamine kinase-like enzyme